MARKTDPQGQQNTDNGAHNERGSAANDGRDNIYNEGTVTNESDTIKNANAAGLGAIGRSDQKQTGSTSNPSRQAGNE